MHADSYSAGLFAAMKARMLALTSPYGVPGACAGVVFPAGVSVPVILDQVPVSVLAYMYMYMNGTLTLTLTKYQVCAKKF